jgi:undecaprenyl-phosphate 4-deoxy-4-formamido-L-arabinose transferase
LQVSVVVPAYNSEKFLQSLVAELTLRMPEYASNYEIILVNDGSPDRTWAVIQSLAETYPNICGLNLSRNSGQHNALLAGIRMARYEVVVTMDDDGQNPVDQIPKLLKGIEDGFDVVYGKPIAAKHDIMRNYASDTTKLVLQSAMGADNARNISSFRALRTRLRDAFQAYSNPFVSIDVLLTWATTKFTAVEVAHKPRIAGKSNYNLMKLIAHATNLITGFSTLPLRIASLLGISFGVFGIFVLAYVLGRYTFQGCPVQGFPFLASIIALFSGAQLFALGIVGEYLSRIYTGMMGKPVYSIGQIVTSKDILLPVSANDGANFSLPEVNVVASSVIASSVIASKVIESDVSPAIISK